MEFKTPLGDYAVRLAYEDFNKIGKVNLLVSNY